MPLYKAIATVELYFYQDEKPNEYDIADAVENEASQHEIDNYLVTQIHSLDEVSEKWKNSCPYGEDGDQNTVAGWMEHQSAIAAH